VKIARRASRLAAAALLLPPAYASLAYVLLPLSWREYHRIARPAPTDGCTRTAEGIAGDPLNVAFTGARPELLAAMAAAGWHAADRITLASGWKDARSIVLDRPYPTAPVSTHFLFGRPQDLAFERLDGRSPRRRHHVRLWQTGDAAWIGAATYDRSVGVSRFTGEVMHHIDPDVDAERRALFEDLARAGRLARIHVETGPRPAGEGRNGGGDRYRTDGELWTGVVLAAARPGRPAALLTD